MQDSEMFIYIHTTEGRRFVSLNQIKWVEDLKGGYLRLVLDGGREFTMEGEEAKNLLVYLKSKSVQANGEPLRSPPEATP